MFSKLAVVWGPPVSFQPPSLTPHSSRRWSGFVDKFQNRECSGWKRRLAGRRWWAANWMHPQPPLLKGLGPREVFILVSTP